MRPLFQSNETGYILRRRGKVRDVYSLNEKVLMIIACDRISAFDRVLPTPIPDKGRILTALSNHWFDKTSHIIPNHLLDTDPSWMDWYCDDEWYYEEMRGRVVLARQAQPLPIEAIVRGYITGSAWKEYTLTGTIHGQRIRPGLSESEALPQPLFTPSTKALDGGHDVNIGYEEAERLLGSQLARRVREASLDLYAFASEYARQRGVIIADTKFEFGLAGDELILIDELITPDSSRFWPATGYQPGRPQASFDKQYVRDHLLSVGWRGDGQAPELPQQVVSNTTARYQEALTRLTGTSLAANALLQEGGERTTTDRG